MREHIHRLNGHDFISGIEQSNVAGLSGRIAADIHKCGRLSTEYCVHHVLMHTGTRRINDHNVRTSMLSDESVSKHVLHVSCIEKSIVYPVDAGIKLRIFYGFRNIFYAHDLIRISRHKVGYCACTCVKVIDKRPSAAIFSIQTGKPAGHLIKLVCLGRIGLVKRLGIDAELQSLHLLLYVIISAPRLHIKVAYRVVKLEVHHIKERCDLWESCLQSLHHHLYPLLVIFPECQAYHRLSCRGNTYHKCTQKASVLSDVIERQTVVLSESVDVITDFIPERTLQMAFGYMQYFVERTGNVESERVRRIGEFLS